MNKFKHVFLLLSILLLLIPLGSAQAQDYRFSLTAYEVEAYLEADGTLTLYYYMAFQMILPGMRLILSISAYPPLNTSFPTSRLK